MHGKRAQLVLDEYGWRIHNVGEGDWYLNQSVLPASGGSPLRSGDIVRLSEVGPDFRFCILPDPKPAPSKTHAGPVAAEEEALETDPPMGSPDEVVADRGTGHFTSLWPAIAFGALVFALVLASLIALRSSGCSAKASPVQSPETEPTSVPVEQPGDYPLDNN